MAFGRLVCASLVAVALVAHAPLARAESRPEPVPGTPQAGDPCGSETHLESLLARDPALAMRRSMLENMVGEAQRLGLAPKPGANSSTSATIYTIPVVVHIVHDNGPENISDAQVLSQIAAVNRDFQNQPNSALPAVDCQLQFCLASNDGAGNAVSWPGAPGITRTQDALKCVVQFGNNASDIALKQIAYFPSNQFLNVWVVKAIQINGAASGIVGYATFPGTVPATQDGVVMDYRVMGADNTGGYGTFATLLPTYTDGKVFTHEVGHWLDLYHTFHGGCNVGDQVSDTPPEANNNWGCPTTTILTCGNNSSAPDPIHNFMEYTNDPCRYQFTDGQRLRMLAAITTYRSQLVSPANLASVGACPSILFANVTLNPSQGCMPLTVQCSAPSCGGSGCTYSWTASGGSVANPTAQSTSATFTAAGSYKVTVTMTDGSNNSSTASANVYVTNCTPISGPCTNWVFGNNCRLNFATGYPVPVAGTSNVGPECATQISSSTGSLLFYTDNQMIWDVTNAPMSGSMANNLPVVIGGNSAHNGSIIIPRPGSTTQYFMFSVREAEQFGNPNPLRINTIDMSANGGLGALTVPNVVISLPSAGANGQPVGLLEGVTVIPNCNAIDWWLITAGAYGVNTSNDWEQFIYVTPITAAGAGTTIAYAVGFTEPNATSYTAWGAITASRDGSKFAVCQAFSQAIHVYDFNRATGVPTLAVNTGDVDCNQDVAFSPDGKVLYFPYLVGLPQGISGAGLYGLRQFDLGTLQMRDLRTPVSLTLPPDVELGPDDKVYSARPGETSLDCINYPNNFNALFNNECGYNPLSVPVGGLAVINTHGALPNTVGICSPTALPPATFSYTITGCTTVSFKTPNCAPWNWTFGDGGTSSVQNPTHTYAPGTYNATLTTSGSPPSVQQQIKIGAQPVSIVGPSNACGGPINYTAVGPSTYTYTWTVTNGTPASASGINILVNWGPGSGGIQVTATDPATGCTSTANLTNDGCGDCAKPPADMVAWWPLDELAGPLAQDIVGANDGQDVGGPTIAAGAVSNCRKFLGTAAQYVMVNDNPKLNLGTNNLTLDAWVNTSSGASPQTIFEKRSLTTNRGYALYLKQGRLALWLGDGTGGTEYTDPNSVNVADGQWHHVAATEDRFDSIKGTRLYVDGTVVLYQPGYSPSAGISNAEQLLIGVQAVSSTTTDWFVGRVDEVEIFSRALSADEVMQVWGAGSKGKCKEFAYVPSSQIVCEGQTSVIVPVTICNYGPTASFNLTFAGLPGCTGPLPTGFQFYVQSQSNPVPVQHNQCLVVPIRVTTASMTQGQISCFSVTATNTTSNVAHVAHGSIGLNYSLCPRLVSGGLTTLGIATARTVTYQLTNTSPAPRSVPVMVDARLASGAPLGPGAAYVSLNGLPPGVPWSSNYFLGAGDSVDVTVDASFLTPLPFEFFDLVLAADSDGDGTMDMETSAGLLYSEQPTRVTAVPAAPPTGRLELVGATPNPFRRDLAVEFELTRRGRVDLALFDVGGRRVRTSIDAQANAGRSIRTISATGLASGVYFVRLDAEGRVFTRRVVLIKD